MFLSLEVHSQFIKQRQHLSLPLSLGNTTVTTVWVGFWSQQ